MLLQILSCVLVLFFTRVAWRRWKYDLHRIPSPPTVRYFVEFLQAITQPGKGNMTVPRGRWWKKLGYPKLMKVTVFGQTRLYVCDINCAKSLVNSNRDPFPRAGLGKDGFVMLIGNDLNAKSLTSFTGVEPYVKAVRRIYSTAFQTSNLKLALPKLKSVIHRMLDIVDEERQDGPVDLQKLCVRMTLDAIGEVAFECNLGGLDGSRDIPRLLIDVGHISISRRLNPVTAFKRRFLPNCRTILQQDETVSQLRAEWAKIADDIMERDDPPPGAEPIWYGLKHLTDPETGKGISRATLLAEVGIAVLAGMDTTGHQLAWLLALLSCHPEVENKILEELKEHGLMGAEARDVVFDDLSELTYLNACVKEGMRVAGITPGTFFRRVPRDMTILGYRIPKGTTVTLPGSRGMNSEADWGPDPDAFKPERWLSGEDMSQKYYFAFSFGPRDCVGQRLALTEMKIALVIILRRYRLSLTVPYETLLKYSRNGVAIEARDGMWFNVSLRSEA